MLINIIMLGKKKYINRVVKKIEIIKCVNVKFGRILHLFAIIYGWYWL